MNISVGQKLWRVYLGNYPKRPSEYVTVKKIGRLWFTIEEDSWPRFSIDRLYEDANNYTSKSRLYFDRDTYEAQSQAQEAYRELKNRLGYNIPDGVTLADVTEAKRLLRA
jgi:hypothetical protein